MKHLDGFTLQAPHPFAGREAYQCEVCDGISYPEVPDACPYCKEERMSENLYDEKHDEAADKHGAPTTHGDTGGAPLSGKNPAGYDEVEAMQAKPLGTEEIGSGQDWNRER